MKTSNLQIRIPEKLRKNSDLIFARIGMDTSTAVRVFLNQVVYQKGLPFEAKIPDEEFERLEIVPVDSETQTLMDKVGNALDKTAAAAKRK